MARGNQRDKAREKTQKEQAAQVRPVPLFAYLCCVSFIIGKEKMLTFLLCLEKEEHCKIASVHESSKLRFATSTLEVLWEVSDIFVLNVAIGHRIRTHKRTTGGYYAPETG